MPSFTITVPTAASAEAIAAAERRWPRNAGETNAQYVERIVKRFFFRPLIDGDRDRAAREAAAWTPVSDADLGG